MKFILIVLLFLLSLISAKDSKNFFTQYVYSGYVTGGNDKYQIATETKDPVTNEPVYHNQISDTEYHFLIKNSKYRLIRFLSCGGFGCAYIIEKKAFPHKRLVLKLASESNSVTLNLKDVTAAADSPILQIAAGVLAKQKQGECKNVMKIKHIFTFFTNKMAMTLELIDGSNLHKVIHDANSIFHPVPVAANPTALQTATRAKECKKRRQIFTKIASDIVSGMECIHSKYQMWHFDIKTQNIMVNKQNEAIIIDIDGMVTDTIISNPNIYISTTEQVSPDHKVHTPGSEDPKPTRRSPDFMDWNKRYDDFTIGMVLCKMLIAVTNDPAGVHRPPNSFLQLNEQVKVQKRFNLDQPNKDDRDFCLDVNNQLGNGIDFPAAQINRWRDIVTGLLNYDRTQRMQLPEVKRRIKVIKENN